MVIIRTKNAKYKCKLTPDLMAAELPLILVYPLNSLKKYVLFECIDLDINCHNNRQKDLIFVTGEMMASNGVSLHQKRWQLNCHLFWC